jgi:FkbM family methyltransferase
MGPVLELLLLLVVFSRTASGDTGQRYISNAVALIGGSALMHSERSILPLVAHWRSMLPSLQHLPLVDVGAHYGVDLVLPTARLGHRVYAYEPSMVTFRTLLFQLDRSNITHTASVDGFEAATGGTVYVCEAAVSNRAGTAQLTYSSLYQGVASTLGGTKALPKSYVGMGTKQVRVRTVRLTDELARETDGVFLLKIDAQGHEYHVLQGALEYARSRPIYAIMLEFCPMLLLAAKVEPIALLRLLTLEMGYQCFDNHRPGYLLPNQLSMTLEAFVDAHPPNSTRQHKFGEWTDLLCLRLDLLRRVRRV